MHSKVVKKKKRFVPDLSITQIKINVLLHDKGFTSCDLTTLHTEMLATLGAYSEEHAQ